MSLRIPNHYHAGDFHPLFFAGFYRRFRLDSLFVYQRLQNSMALDRSMWKLYLFIKQTNLYEENI